MTDCKYLDDRLEEQIRWYGKKANQNKNRFYGYQIVIIVSGVLVPIINAANFGSDEVRVISSILGGIIVGITSILQLKKHHENWIQYRSTEEVLKKEKYFFLNNVGLYSELEDKKKCERLVRRVESVISNQNVRFFDAHGKDEQ